MVRMVSLHLRSRLSSVKGSCTSAGVPRGPKRMVAEVAGMVSRMEGQEEAVVGGRRVLWQRRWVGS